MGPMCSNYEAVSLRLSKIVILSLSSDDNFLATASSLSFVCVCACESFIPLFPLVPGLLLSSLGRKIL